MYTPNSSSVATNTAPLSDRRPDLRRRGLASGQPVKRQARAARPAARTDAWTLVSTHTDEARRTWLTRRPVTA